MGQNQTGVGRHPVHTVLLSITAAGTLTTAYLLGFAVLTDTDMASKFENGVAPAGTDIEGLRIAAGASIVAAICAWVSAIATQKAVPILLVSLAAVPFGLMSLVTLRLAF
ncbi:hypothetical protein [Mycolicibacterium pulveris]|uniref:hypothetical protein n=1 Tax=Mycolicibacterium pulveris TaxID=36813 RepID=UPI003CF10B52